MKNGLLGFVLLLGMSTTAFADTEWVTAEVTNITVLESLPVQYQLSYQVYCNEVDAQEIKFVRGIEAVVGVAVKVDHSKDGCLEQEETPTIRTLTIERSVGSVGTVSILR